MNDFIWLKDKQGDVCSSLLAASHYIDSHCAWDPPDFLSPSVIKFALYDAVCHFNNGNRTTLDILKEVGIEPASALQKLASQIIGTASRKHPITALMPQSKLEKKGDFPLEQRHTRVRFRMKLATNIDDFMALHHHV